MKFITNKMGSYRRYHCIKGYRRQTVYIFGMSPDQIRKDLSYFGKFGRQGRGYNVALLLSELRQILGLDRQWCMAIVGVGRLGRAIMDYKGFVPRGFKIVAAFDKERNVIGKRVSGVVIQDMAELETAIREKKVDIAVVAVPSTEAQEVIDKLVFLCRIHRIY